MIDNLTADERKAFERTLLDDAKQLAKQAYAEVIVEPEAYGITTRWRNVQEWIDFELDGEAPQTLKRVYGIPYARASDLLTEAMLEIANLDELNANIPDDNPEPEPFTEFDNDDHSKPPGEPQ